MKKLLLISIFFTWAIIVPIPTMAGLYINAGFPLQPPIVFEAPPKVLAMPDTSGVYIVADVYSDTPQGGSTGKDEKQQVPALEKEKPAVSEDKSDFKINVWPVQPPDNVKSLPEMKDENKHTPPGRF